MKTSTVPVVERVHPPRWLISHLVNPFARKMLRLKSMIGDEVLLLRFTGRRSGRRYEIPVGYRRIDGRIGLLTNSGWRHNFRQGRDVEIVLRGETMRASASLLDEPLEVATIYAQLIAEHGLNDAPRRLGIKINVDREPTVDELADMARGSGMSVVWIDPQ
jgi:hypothetical protein